MIDERITLNKIQIDQITNKLKDDYLSDMDDVTTTTENEEKEESYKFYNKEMKLEYEKDKEILRGIKEDAEIERNKKRIESEEVHMNNSFPLKNTLNPIIDNDKSEIANKMDHLKLDIINTYNVNNEFEKTNTQNIKISDEHPENIISTNIINNTNDDENSLSISNKEEEIKIKKEEEDNIGIIYINTYKYFSKNKKITFFINIIYIYIYIY